MWGARPTTLSADGRPASRRDGVKSSVRASVSGVTIAMLFPLLLLLGERGFPILPATAEASGVALQPRLVVTTRAGEVLVDVPLPPDLTWSLEWLHSVAQVIVVDRFAYREGIMLVTEQVTPHLDIAGLGGFAGRGTMEQLPDGRYRLHGIDLPLHGNVHDVIIGTERAPSVLVVGDERFELSVMRPGTAARMEVVVE